MTTTESSHRWDELFEIASGFLQMDDFERLERGYKLEIAESIGELASAARAGAEIDQPLRACLKHKENNLLSWQAVDTFLTWAKAQPDESTTALRILFDEATAPLDALQGFLDRFPKEVVSGRGGRLALGSFFLMGRDPHKFPIYRTRAVDNVRKILGWESHADDAVSEYQDALEMFDSFRAEASAAGVPVESALHAQGLLYATAQWEPADDWPPGLRALVQQIRRDSEMMSETLSLKNALAQYDRSAADDRRLAAVEEREQFVTRFPVTSWGEMPLERYALGLEDSKEGVSYWLEWGTTDCGSIKGGAATKHLVYFSIPLDRYKFESKYANEHEAWEAIRSGVLDLLRRAAESDFAAIDEIESLWAAPVVRAKLAWLYFPDQLLPIYSETHLDFWLSIFKIKPGTSGRVAKNRALLRSLHEMPEFEGWQPLEIMHFLYSWTTPNPSQTILKIAPGEAAFLWDDCLTNGRIRLGWDGTEDLSLFDTDEELRAHYEQIYPEDNKSTTTRTVRALKTFRDLTEGDIVVANEGTKKVLGIGRVTDGYFFQREFEEYRHSVGVDWFDSTEREVDFGSAWMFTLVSIKPDDYHKILRSGKIDPPSLPPLPPIPSMHREAEMLLDRSGQIIFYGPPGTGKTYAARRHAAWLLGGGSTEPEAARAFGEPHELVEIEAQLLRAPETDERPSWVLVANPSYWSFDELFEKGSEQYDYGRLQRNYEEVAQGDEVFGYEATPKKRIVATARVTRSLYTTEAGKQHIDIEPDERVVNAVTWEMLKDDPVLAASEPVSNRMQGTLFRLEPTEAARLRSLTGLDDENGKVSTGVAQLTRVTFHPTYAYEDFIEGYKPTESGAGGLELAMRDGVFKRVCKAAAADPQTPYVLMIDEINRGNVPKIFGELITLIEKDKRGMPLTLPQSNQSFHVPDNVHIIATMNTADRSIHILDAALRRRFAFVELLPDPAVLNTHVGPLPLEGFLAELNVRVRSLVGREKQVGHAVLMKAGQPIASATEFALSFKYELLPLLQEYTYGNYTDLTELLGEEVVDVDNQVTRAEVLDDPVRLIEALAKHLELG